jgi:hypothetical protein
VAQQFDGYPKGMAQSIPKQSIPFQTKEVSKSIIPTFVSGDMAAARPGRHKRRGMAGQSSFHAERPDEFRYEKKHDGLVILNLPAAYIFRSSIIIVGHAPSVIVYPVQYVWTLHLKKPCGKGGGQ